MLDFAGLVSSDFYNRGGMNVKGQYIAVCGVKYMGYILQYLLRRVMNSPRY